MEAPMRIPWLLLWLGLAGCESGTGLGVDGAPVDLAAAGGDGATDLLQSGADLSRMPDFAHVPDFATGNTNAQVACGTMTCKSPANVCCRATPFGPGTCITPVASCGEQKYACDDPS